MQLLPNWPPYSHFWLLQTIPQRATRVILKYLEIQEILTLGPWSVDKSYHHAEGQMDTSETAPEYIKNNTADLGGCWGLVPLLRISRSGGAY